MILGIHEGNVDVTIVDGVAFYTVTSDGVEKAEEFREKIKVEWEGVKVRRNGGVEEEWGLFKEAVLRCAKEVCGVRKVGGTRRRGSEWWDEELKQ